MATQVDTQAQALIEPIEERSVMKGFERGEEERQKRRLDPVVYNSPMQGETSEKPG
jgi:hypothetical protein